MKFVSKDLAIKLKEKGFDKPCFGWYDNQITDSINLYLNVKEGAYTDLLEYTNDFEWIIDAPTIEQVLEWLREEKKIHIVIDFTDDMVWYFQISKYYTKHYEHQQYGYRSYEDACIAGIEYVVEHLI